jgi:hypothetical protein
MFIWQLATMTSEGFFYFVVIFESYLLYSHHSVDALILGGNYFPGLHPRIGG